MKFKPNIQLFANAVVPDQAHGIGGRRDLDRVWDYLGISATAVQSMTGLQFGNILYVQDSGQKEENKLYIDKITGKLYKAKVTTSKESVTSEEFEDMTLFKIIQDISTINSDMFGYVTFGQDLDQSTLTDFIIENCTKYKHCVLDVMGFQKVDMVVDGFKLVNYLKPSHILVIRAWNAQQKIHITNIELKMGDHATRTEADIYGSGGHMALTHQGHNRIGCLYSSVELPQV